MFIQNLSKPKLFRNVDGEVIGEAASLEGRPPQPTGSLFFLLSPIHKAAPHKHKPERATG